MLTLFRSDTICSPEEAKELMSEQIKQLPAKIFSVGSSVKILRYELSCEPVNILAWLHNQRIDTKVYFSDRDGNFEMGGIGITDEIKGAGPVDHEALFSHMESRLAADNPHLRYYGGLSFDDSHCHDEWQKFGTYQFIIPQFEVFQSKAQTTFAFNMAISDISKENIETILVSLKRIDFSTQTTYRNTPQLLSRADFPNKEEWESIFTNVHHDTDEALGNSSSLSLRGAKRRSNLNCQRLSAFAKASARFLRSFSEGELRPFGARNDEKFGNISDSHLNKIVLARKSVFDFDVELRSDALLKHLKDRTPDCFHFCFQPSEDTAFLGATPERLYKRQQQNIQSEAIAGTRPRGGNDREDTELEGQLLNSAKDALEHKYVVDAVRHALDPYCSSVRCDKTSSLRKLKGSQHLLTGFEGELREGVCDHQILASLHPTPAVAGCPTEQAVHTIKQLEPFDRGWYTGPVGYVSHDTAEFVVAIRCGLINKNQLSLYAGAGIVDGSRCEDEWNEIENKISNFIDVFNK